MAPLKLFLLCSGIAAGEECLSNCEAPGDQTALLQSHLSRKGELAAHHTALLHFPSLGNLKDPKKRRGSLAQFEQTATNLVKDKGSVTPAVVALASSIVDMLEGDGGALAAIQDEHDNDVNQLEYEFRVFAPMLQRLHDLIASMRNYNSTALHESHLECRHEESQLCQHFGECTSNEEELQEDVNDAQDALDEIDQEINDNWCVPPHDDRTEVVFRVNQKALFIRYNAALAHLTSVQTTLGEATSSCAADESTWSERRTDCNGLQADLESTACQHKGLVDHDVAGFTQSWQLAVDRYDETKASILVDQGDRIVEWTTVKKVVCLLNQLQNPDAGSVSSAGTVAAIEDCHDLMVLTDHLLITFLPTPSLPSIPRTTSENPCTETFRVSHYSAIELCPIPGSNPVQSYKDETGAVEDCNCLIDTDTRPFIAVGEAFPHALISYLLYDAGAAFGADGFSVDVAAKTWRRGLGGATTMGVVTYNEVFNGVISAISAISLPALNEAYGLSGDNVVASYAWAYPSNDHEFSVSISENAMGRFFRTGGYVYMNAGGAVVALKDVTPWHGVDDAAQMTLHWLSPVSVSSAQTTSACDAMHPVTSGRLKFGGAMEYCWAGTGTDVEGCQHGCFIFKTQSDEYLSFGIMV